MGEAEAIQAEDKHGDSGIAPAEDSVIWSQEVEVCLFHAMLGHKPVGVNRHFHMICIRDKFSQNIGRQVSSKVIWDHLGTMYDMQALHESEILPFPNAEKSFVLPEEIIQEVKEGKLGMADDVKEELTEEGDQPATHEEGLGPSLAGQEFEREEQENLGMLGSNNSLKISEKANIKEKERDRERGSNESTAKDTADKRKKNRVTEKVLSSNSNPSSPGGTKRRRT